jgi:FkbM family methyltransferase
MPQEKTGWLHPLRRLRIKTRRKARVSAAVLRTQAGGPSSRLALLAYTWLPVAWRGRPPAIRVSTLGRSAVFRPKSHYDLEVWRDVFADGDYDAALPEDPRVIFDLGAHVGLSALYYALKYPEARVYAFEAEPSNAALLAENLAPLENAFAFPYAICGSDRPVTLHVHERSVSHSLVERSASGREVEVSGRGLDSLMDELGLERVDLIKFNIEGVEFETLGAFRRRDEVGAYVGYLHFDLADVDEEAFLASFDAYDVRFLPSKPQRYKMIAVRREPGGTWR